MYNAQEISLIPLTVPYTGTQACKLHCNNCNKDSNPQNISIECIIAATTLTLQEVQSLRKL